eukprot:SAG25_NODE_124_length_14606_cov_739.419177_17_plen_103_part_00
MTSHAARPKRHRSTMCSVLRAAEYAARSRLTPFPVPQAQPELAQLRRAEPGIQQLIHAVEAWPGWMRGLAGADSGRGGDKADTPSKQGDAVGCQSGPQSGRG